MQPHLYHAHHSQYQADLPFWLGLAAQLGSPVLELGCGTGRVLMPLAQAGYRTVGIDKDLPMLRFLQANIEPGWRHTPLLVAADITHFGMADRFPLVILPCNTYSTLNAKERVSCLSCIGECLCPGGTLALSVPNPLVIKRLPATSDAELEDEFLHPHTGNPVQVSSAWQRKKDTFEVNWIYDHLLPNGEAEHAVIKSVHHVVGLATYLDEIQQAGLSIGATYGDFDCSDYTNDSPNLIILASRPEY